MIITRKFTPITITVESKADLDFLKDLATLALLKEPSGFNFLLRSATCSEGFRQRTENFLRDIQ